MNPAQADKNQSAISVWKVGLTSYVILDPEFNFSFIMLIYDILIDMISERLCLVPRLKVALFKRA